MAPFFTPGVIFASGDQVTAAKLNNLVANATPLDFNRTHFDSSTRVLTAAASETNGALAGELYFDTANARLAYHNGSRFLRVAPFMEHEFTVNSVASVGDVLIQDTGTGNQLVTTTTAGSMLAVGVLGAAVSSAPTTARVATSGVVTVNCDGTAVSIGDYLTTSTTAGRATSGGAGLVDGAFARALTSKSSGVGTVTALLMAPQQIETISTTETEETYLNFSTTGTATDNTWFDVPDATSATFGTDGSEAMNVDFTTTVDDQLVHFELQNFTINTSSGSVPDGFRVLLDDTAVLTVNADGSFTVGSAAGATGPVRWVSTTRIDVVHLTTSMVVPTAGAHAVRLQLLPRASGSITVTSLGTNTASLAVRFETIV